jgi:3-hydroxyacyl-CoA dehydrogenase
VSTDFYIQKVAILGAGTMGAQIAAFFAGAGIKTYLYDLPGKDKDKNQLVIKSIDALRKLQPSPLVSKEVADLIEPANYEDHLEYLRSCDLVLEAVAERPDIKAQLFSKILPYLGEKTILASNTSGLSINELATHLPETVKQRFLGIHFFNPPRYLPLVELISGEKTSVPLMQALETFLVSTLGKTVIYAKDTPNFIANRIGVFSILAVCHYAEQFNIGLEVVDALTGKLLGRPKSATFRTADLVGLDVLGHVVDTMNKGLSSDPWHAYFQSPSWIQVLVKQGALGQKTKKGIYHKQADGLYVWGIANKQYRLSNQKADAGVVDILKEKDLVKRFKALRESTHPQAQFLWACHRELFAYCAYCLPEIAHTTRDIDLAIRKGYGWKEGPFEIWQQAGFTEILSWIEADVEAAKTMAKITLPSWVKTHKPYEPGKAFSASESKYLPRTQLPVYQRQLFYDATFNETFDEGKTLYENEGVRLWQLGNDGIGILSFKSKMCTVSEQVLDGIFASITVAEQQCKAMVIWQRHGQHFSAGADLMQAGEKFLMEGPPALETMLTKFQNANLALRYAKVPVVAAVRGYAFGGGCEMLMHSDHVVACVESYIGLVEVAVGLIPGAGGCKELALRASQAQNPEKALQDSYKHVAMAEVAKSAFEARQIGYLRQSDTIIVNSDELLYVAKVHATALAESNYRAPLPQQFKVIGRPGIATIRMLLANMKEGQQISEYDYFISDRLADIMCGGQIDGNTVVDEEWVLRKERQVFMELVENEKTFQRIQHMLDTGKPLRN